MTAPARRPRPPSPASRNRLGDLRPRDPRSGCLLRGFDRAAVSAYGTAARATFFVALEQPGPWGRETATQSHLPAAVGSSLSEACDSRGGRLTLIRRPGRHADRPPEGAHTAYFAWSGTDPWLLVTRVEAAEALLETDLDALARGDRRAVRASLPGAAPSEPILRNVTRHRPL